jgi:hypothetical protein
VLGEFHVVKWEMILSALGSKRLRVGRID